MNVCKERKIFLGLLLLSVMMVIFIWNRRHDPRFMRVTYYVQPLVKRFQLSIIPTPTRLPIKRVMQVNCAAILRGDEKEITKAERISTRHSNISESIYLNLTRDCNNFKISREYHVKLSPSESSFPLVYSILLYKEVEQAERLLRAIYSPNNQYCFHVDADSPPIVHEAIQAIADCFDNVFVVSKKEYIVYSGFSRLQADLNCIDNLLQRGNSWKYFINLPSQQFPIKTNAEIVKILKMYGGSNDIEGITGNRMLQNRFKFRHVYKILNAGSKAQLSPTDILKDNAPHNISVVKGSAYGVFSRAFVEFVHKSRIARDLLDWLRDVNSPDEYYWATLHHNPQIGVPGAYKGNPDDKEWLAVYASWGGQDPCEGKFVHGVCVFGIADLPGLWDRPELFVNKFHLDFQPLALDCIEEWHLNRTAVGATDLFNETFYSNLKFVKP